MRGITGHDTIAPVTATAVEAAEGTDAQRVVLGRLIRIGREAKGLSQTDLGEAVTAKQSTVSSWESGKVTPSLEQLVRIARALDVDQGVLLEGAAAEFGY